MKLSTIAVTLATAVGALAESHTVHFNNKCGSGTPVLIQGPNVLARGKDYTSNGPINSAIAYLDNGKCGFNGENCITVELTLTNPDPSKPGSGSSVDLSLIPPHAFSQRAGFQYKNGCTQGTSCDKPDCTTAFHKPPQTGKQIACQKADVDLDITFC